MSVGTGIAFGMVPALKTANVDLIATIRDEGETLSTRRRWFGAKNALVVVQVALSVILLVGAGVLFRSLSAAAKLDLGFAVEGVA